jgi:hypothetical protein
MAEPQTGEIPKQQDTRGSALGDVLAEVFTHIAMGHTIAAWKMDGTSQYKFVCSTANAGCDLRRIVFAQDLPKPMKDKIRQIATDKFPVVDAEHAMRYIETIQDHS